MVDIPEEIEEFTIESVSVLGQPNGIIVNENNNKAYLTNQSGLVVIDLKKKIVEKNIPLPTSSLAVTDIDKNNKYLSLCTFNSAYICEIENDLTFKELIKGSAIYDAAIVGGYLYASAFNDRVIYVSSIETNTRFFIDPYEQNGNVATPSKICKTPNEKIIIGEDETDRILYTINTETNKVSSFIPISSEISNLKSFNDSIIIVTTRNADKLIFINIKDSNNVFEAVTIDSLGKYPDIVCNKEENAIYLVNDIFSHYKDNGPFGSSYYYLPELIKIDYTKKKIEYRKILPVAASNSYGFKVGLIKSKNELIIAASNTLYFVSLTMQ